MKNSTSFLEKNSDLLNYLKNKFIIHENSYILDDLSKNKRIASQNVS